MKLRFYELDVRVSELQTTRVSVASWEYPVLQAVWGDSVSFVNEVLVERKAAPDPTDEFRRLANRYGSAEVEGAPFVSAVYGQFGPGVAALAQAISEGIFEGATAAVERPATDVLVAGQVPDNIANRVNQLEKELAEAKILQADTQIEEAEKTPLVVTQEILDAGRPLATEDNLPRVEGKLSDDEIVDLIGDGESSAA